MGEGSRSLPIEVQVTEVREGLESFPIEYETMNVGEGSILLCIEIQATEVREGSRSSVATGVDKLINIAQSIKNGISY